MQQISFNTDMTKSRRMIYWASLLMLVLGIASAIMLFLGGRRWFVAVEITSGIAIVVFFLMLAFLLSFFMSKPEVKEKRNLIYKVRQNSKEMELAQANLADALKNKKSAEETYGEQKSKEIEEFGHLAESVRQRISVLGQAQQQELQGALAGVQAAHLTSGLRGVVVDPAHVPGIGDMLAEKLHQSGISTAYDLTGEAIRAIPGFGESKTLSLLRWRESLENELRSTQPSELPAEKSGLINQKYAQQKLLLEEELAGAQHSHGLALEKLREAESKALAAAEVMEAEAHQDLGNLETQKQQLTGQLDQYQNITFQRLLLAILIGPQENWKTRIGSYLAFGGFFVLGIANIILLIILLIISRN